MSDFDPRKLRGLLNDDFEPPDLAGTVEGWRAWGVPAALPPFGTAPKLYSLTHRQFFWDPRQASEAECGRCKAIPGETCSCGFYSAKTLEHLKSMGYHTYDAERDGEFHVVGQVANWGKVIEATSGWRSQFSYPARLYVPFEAWELAKPLSRAYGVPVTLANNLTPPPKKRST